MCSPISAPRNTAVVKKKKKTLDEKAFRKKMSFYESCVIDRKKEKMAHSRNIS